MNALRNFILIVIRNNTQAIYATWLQRNLASYQTSICTLSSIGSPHNTFKSVTGLLSMFQTSYVLSRCVVNVKPWNMLMSIANSVKSVHTRSGKFID